MARRTFQAPKPKRRGKWWCLLYWQDEFLDGRRVRKRKRVNLAPLDTPEREVNKIAAEHLRPMNQGLTTVGSATNFADFVDTVYGAASEDRQDHPRQVRGDHRQLSEAPVPEALPSGHQCPDR
jgi:hypothetical protein